MPYGGAGIEPGPYEDEPGPYDENFERVFQIAQETYRKDYSKRDKVVHTLFAIWLLIFAAVAGTAIWATVKVVKHYV